MDFAIPGQLVSIISLVFNVTSTWILAGFFFIKTYRIKHGNISERVMKFQNEVNEKIQNLKS